MASVEDVAQRLKESRPPATDAFTYLTIIDKSLTECPDVLPLLSDILSDAEITEDIGWDLVDKIVSLPGAGDCLDKIARLGNPREVILKTTETLETMCSPQLGGDLDQDGMDQVFERLMHILPTLHKRLRVKKPSLFLQTSINSILEAYAGTARQTFAVIHFIRAMAGSARPAPPPRQASTARVTPTNGNGDSNPDPEGEKDDVPSEDERRLEKSLLRAFVTHVLSAYANRHKFDWSSRLMEWFDIEKLRPEMWPLLMRYGEIEELKDRDDAMGQLAALADDLGLSKLDKASWERALDGPLSLAQMDDKPEADGEILPSPSGMNCLLAYCMFSEHVYDGQRSIPKINLLPLYNDILQGWIEGTGTETPQRSMRLYPTTFESVLVTAVYLLDAERITENAGTDFMAAVHYTSLIALFHPVSSVRGVAAKTAGRILHADPDVAHRVEILKDTFTECQFANLKACAVEWLKAEIISGDGVFGSAQAMSALQESVFPDLRSLGEDADALADFWLEEAPYHLQLANLLFFLVKAENYKGRFEEADGVKERYVTPMMTLAQKLEEGRSAEQPEAGEMKSQLAFLMDLLSRVAE